jgi:hypothetical protein
MGREGEGEGGRGERERVRACTPYVQAFFLPLLAHSTCVRERERERERERGEREIVCVSTWA